MDNTPKLRGAILLDQIRFIEREHGRQIVSNALSTLTSEVREEVEGALPISWLNVASVTAFKTAIAAELGEDPVAFNRRVVRASIGETISTVWRLLLRQLWDGAIIKRTPIIYSKAFDRGKMSVHMMKDGRAELHLVGWPDMPDFDCAGVAAGIEAILEYTNRGASIVRWRREAPLVIFGASWRPSILPSPAG